MSFQALSLLIAGAGCVSKGEDTASDGGGDSGHAADSADTGDSGQQAPNPYTTYSGWEQLDFGTLMPAAGEYNCHLRWAVTGTPRATVCTGCEFVFDVDITLLPAESTDDGTCAADGKVGDFEYAYAYSPEYYGYGSAWLYEYDGDFIWWGDATFEDGQFRYQWGYTDYYYAGTYGYVPEYAGYYFTNYQFGAADVR